MLRTCEKDGARSIMFVECDERAHETYGVCAEAARYNHLLLSPCSARAERSSFIASIRGILRWCGRPEISCARVSRLLLSAVFSSRVTLRRVSTAA